MRSRKCHNRSLILLVITLFAISAAGQVTGRPDQTSEAVTLKLNSPSMGREMPFRVILPTGYAEAKSTRFAVVYLLHGLYGHFDNWTDKTGLNGYAAKHNFIIVTAEGEDGWYTDSAVDPKQRYESYIIKDLIPEVEKRFRVIADRDHRFIAGLSMGGYGSIKYGLKYPNLFSIVGSFSGALQAPMFTAANAGAIGKTVDAVYGPEGSDTRKANDIFSLLQNDTADAVKGLPFIYQSCGTEDFLIDSNHKFQALLNEKKAAHEYREHPGAHEWKFWDDQLREFLDVVERRESGQRSAVGGQLKK